jgi:hypothetical protein
LTERENVGRLVDDIEILAKYLNLVADRRELDEVFRAKT